MPEGMPNPQHKLIASEIAAVSSERKMNLMEAAGKREELALSAKKAREAMSAPKGAEAKKMPPPIPDAARRKPEAEQEQAA